MPNYPNNMRGYGRRQMPPPQTMPQVSNICCNVSTDILDGLPVAMAYVPWQDWKCPYAPLKGLMRGTIFEDLDKPFLGKGGCAK